MNQGLFAFHATKRYRSVFLSDFHMGSKRFDALALLDFLQSFECDYLFLSGDIIDGGALARRSHWSEDCSRVLDEILRKGAAGTKIIYLPGNHDDEMRRVRHYPFRQMARRFNFKIRDRVIHTMADGRQFLVMHGDQFDRKILGQNLSRWFDRFCEIVRFFPRRESVAPSQKFSLAKTLQKHGKLSLMLLNNFEHAVYAQAQARDVDGLICGHTHVPAQKNFKGVSYYNSGSWVEQAHTAVVENDEGVLQLVDCPSSYESPPLFDQSVVDMSPAMGTFKLVPTASAYRPVSDKIVTALQALWPQEGKGQENIPALRPVFGSFARALRAEPVVVANKVFTKALKKIRNSASSISVPAKYWGWLAQR